MELQRTNSSVLGDSTYCSRCPFVNKDSNCQYTLWKLIDYLTCALRGDVPRTGTVKIEAKRIRTRLYACKAVI
jgi:hypothetical protein